MVDCLTTTCPDDGCSFFWARSKYSTPPFQVLWSSNKLVKTNYKGFAIDPSKLLATCFWNETGGWMEKSGKEEEGTEEEERKERWSKALGRELRGSKNVFPNPSNPGPIKWLCLPV